MDDFLAYLRYVPPPPDDVGVYPNEGCRVFAVTPLGVVIDTGERMASTASAFNRWSSKQDTRLGPDWWRRVENLREWPPEANFPGKPVEFRVQSR